MLNQEIERRMGEAAGFAKSQGHEYVTIEHILLALTDSVHTFEILRTAGANVPQLRKDLREHLKTHATAVSEEWIREQGGPEQWKPEFTVACHRWIQRAALQVKSSGGKKLTEGHLLVALFFEEDCHAVYLLQKQGVTQYDVMTSVSHGSPLGNETTKGALPQKNHGTSTEEEAAENHSSPLEQFCVNLNEKAKLGKIDPLIGRDDLLERMMQILCRRSKNNPLLIGDPGVGKTAIVEGLARKIQAGQTPEALLGKTVYSLDLGTLLAGAKFRGDFEGRLKSVMSEVKKRNDIILFIDEIHTLVGAGSTGGGSMDASNLLKPALANGDISCIGSTTHQEFRQHFDKDRALSRRFQRIDVSEPSRNDAVAIIQGLAPGYAKHHEVTFTEEALIAAVDLSIKHMAGKTLPDKAIDLLDETGAFQRLHKKNAEPITEKEIAATLSRITGVPVETVAVDDVKKLEQLEVRLKAKIFGQDEAIEKCVTAIQFNRSGLARTNKPVASFLFAGPTGVGKTEVTKQLAAELGIPLVRFDMSEYMEKHTVARLIGAPPGYVGHDQGGQLTEAIHRSPHAVLLLDEIEKAHPDIAQVLLQVMDAGRLTDAQGRVTDFRHVLLIMTSNAGAQEVARGAIGIAQTDAVKHLSDEALKRFFAPEFINRLDAVVQFKSLGHAELMSIVHQLIVELSTQLLEKNVTIEVTEKAREFLLSKGTNTKYGARPLGRALDQWLKKPLVKELLFGKLVKGGRVVVDQVGEELDFHIENRMIALPQMMK